MKVEVQWKKLVKPSAPASASPRHEKLKLSFIDELQPPAYIGIVFYYRDAAEEPGTDAPLRLQRMEESLAETLALFYPFAGRYSEDGHYIDCNDEGVELVLAKVDGRINQLVQQQPDRNLIQRMSNYPRNLSGNPLITIQLNVLRCGGLAIALRFTHKIGDLSTMAMFMKSWASACTGNIREIAHPNFELSSIFPSKESLLPRWSPPQFGKGKLVMSMFVFDRIAISKMKALLQKDLLAPSRFEVISALICRTLINIDEKKHGKFRPFTISIPMNLRDNVGMTVPTNACGNLYAHAIARSESKLELEELKTLIGDTIKHARARYAAVADAEDLCLMVKDAMGNYRKIAYTAETNDIPITSWCRSPLNDNDYGWGKPVLVSPTSPPFKSIYLTDNVVNGGINAWMILDEDEMTLFKQDPDILALTRDYLVGSVAQS